MEILSRLGRSLFLSVLTGLAVAIIVLPLFALANQGSLQVAVHNENAGRADAFGHLFNALYTNEQRTASELASGPSPSAIVAGFASSAMAMQRAMPEITGAFLIGPSGQPLVALQASKVGAPLQRVPSGPSFLTTDPKTAMGRALADTLAAHTAHYLFSFAGQPGPMGDFYALAPVIADNGVQAGAVVLRVDNASLIAHTVSDDHALLIAPPFVIGPSTPGLLANQHQVDVLSDAPSSVTRDPSLVGGMTHTSDSDLTVASLPANGLFHYQGKQEIAGFGTPDRFPDLRVAVHTPAPTFVTSFGQTAFGPVGVLMLILFIGGAGLLFVYQENRLTAATMAIEESRSEVLTRDILAVSDALGQARDGDLTVEVPSADSEVGLISVMINGLLSDYGQMVSGIIEAAREVQDGALRVDEGVRSIVEIASRQSNEMTATAGTVEALAESANSVREATQRAADLSLEASQSVHQGQQAVSRIGEAVDSIKEAAIGTTREFKRLQEDSIRLTALVSSVKSNAENLDMQAANAALEARHLGTETGSAFATNIGRLARQAQETLAEAEGAVRSVIGSIDAVNRRIERISEQVRLGVEEVRSVRSSFADITASNESLVGFIDQVAESAQEQADSAQHAATSISAISEAFKRFNDLLIATSDEMAHMRLVVVGLRESVADIKVEGSEARDGFDATGMSVTEHAA